MIGEPTDQQIARGSAHRKNLIALSLLAEEPDEVVDRMLVARYSHAGWRLAVDDW